MSKKLRDALDEAYNEERHLEAKADTLHDLHNAMRRKRRQHPMLLVRMLRYRMPAYQTIALAGVLCAVIAWLFTTDRVRERIVYVNADTHSSSTTTTTTTVDTDAIIRRVVDSVRNEMRREAEQTRRSLVGETKKSMERVAQDFKRANANADGNNVRPLDSPLPNADAGGLENLTQLQYQQRGRSLADDGIGTRFNDTTTSEALR